MIDTNLGSSDIQTHIGLITTVTQLLAWGLVINRHSHMQMLIDFQAQGLTLTKLHVFVLRSFFNKDPTRFNECLTKPYHGLIEILV